MDTEIMVQDKKSNQDNADRAGNNHPEDLIKMIKKFYQPSEGMQNFEEFFDSIEKKIADQNPVNKIIQQSTELKKDYELRQIKLAEFINRLEHNLQFKDSLKNEVLRRNPPNKKIKDPLPETRFSLGSGLKNATSSIFQWILNQTQKLKKSSQLKLIVSGIVVVTVVISAYLIGLIG